MLAVSVKDPTGITSMGRSETRPAIATVLITIPLFSARTPTFGRTRLQNRLVLSRMTNGMIRVTSFSAGTSSAIVRVRTMFLSPDAIETY